MSQVLKFFTVSLGILFFLACVTTTEGWGLIGYVVATAIVYKSVFSRIDASFRED